MEQKVCPVTGRTFDSGSILLDKRLKKSMDRKTVTGWQIHPEVQDQIDKGFVALVEIDPEKSTPGRNGNLKPQDVWRTGRLAYLRKEKFEQIFNRPADTPFVWIDAEVLERLGINEQK